jgi:proteasome assembly chaperone 3
VVNGIKTDVTCIQFSDKILVTVSQNGRLGHWVRSSAFPPTSLSG